MIRRITHRGKESGRVDDNIDSLKKRFHTFVIDTKKIVDFYAKQNKVVDVMKKNYYLLLMKKIKNF